MSRAFVTEHCLAMMLCVFVRCRLYREHGPNMLEALKRNPALTVPLVLHRLRSKSSELREAKRSQQKVWNDQNHKYFTKSLDHQGLYFKQNDAKTLRSKALLFEIENAFEKVRCISAAWQSAHG